MTETIWTCSCQATRDLEVVAPQATAFEVTWASNERDLARGEVQSVVLPTHPQLRWDPRWLALAPPEHPLEKMRRELEAR